jgi:small-conductance mechanosensitive channel
MNNVFLTALALQATETMNKAPGEPSSWVPLAWAGGAIVFAVILALVLHWVIFAALTRLTKRTGWEFDDIFLQRLRGPARLALILIAVMIAANHVALPLKMAGLLKRGLSLGIIAAISWLVIALLRAGEALVLKRHRVDVADNLEARRVHTQIRVISRTLVVLVVVVGVGAMLMTFDKVQTIGASLLASAGIAGLAVGLAARPVLSNLIAGLQLALTQPVRLDDVVIVEGEWGWIEEITSTYVVVRIWDLRRLVVPLSHFIEKPFENWTRRTADILGTVYLHTDYTVPLEEVRKELTRIVEASPHWDGKVAGLVVTDAKEYTLEIRALVSAVDSSKAWNLRCEVREKLIEFLQREYPQCLPRLRAEFGERMRPAGGITSAQKNNQ